VAPSREVLTQEADEITTEGDGTTTSPEVAAKEQTEPLYRLTERKLLEMS